MIREQFLDMIGDFSWDFGCQFFVETSVGNFIWSDPDYEGDNSFTLTRETLDEYIEKMNIPYVRSKGVHTIRGYCGEDIGIVGFEMNNPETERLLAEAYQRGTLLKEFCLVFIAGGYTPEETAEKLGIDLNYIEKFIRQDLQAGR